MFTFENNVYSFLWNGEGKVYIMRVVERGTRMEMGNA